MRASVLVAALLAASILIDLPPARGDASAPIVFVSRKFDGPFDAARPETVDRARSGRLQIRYPDFNILTLLDSSTADAPEGAPVDVMDPDVSWDGKRIVFSGYSEGEGAWRIFEIGADRSGFRQVTTSDRVIDLSRYGAAAPNFESYDDLDPCYLPDGRICFVSTRYPESAPDRRVRATNIYVVNADGTGVHRITSERFGADTPTVDPTTGTIVFSRWWRTVGEHFGSPSAVPLPSIPPPSPAEPLPNIAPPPPAAPVYYGTAAPPPPPPPVSDPTLPNPNTFSSRVIRDLDETAFPGLNTWFLSSINPDGSDMKMFSGFHLDRVATQAYRPSILPNGEALALFLTEPPFLGRPLGLGLRRLEPGHAVPEPLGGPRRFFRSGVNFLYASAVWHPEGFILLSGSPDLADEPAEFDIYGQLDGENEPVRLFGEQGIAELDAVPLLRRAVPPVLAGSEAEPMPEEPPASPAEAEREGRTFTFQVENIFANAPVDVPIPNAPPVGTPLAIEFYMAPQRASFPGADPPILIRRLDLPASGRISVELPAGVPLFEVLRRPNGNLAVGRDGQVFHVGGLNYGKDGSMGRCVGCHAGHSMMPIPEDPAWTNLASSAAVTASSFREEVIGRDSGGRDRVIAFRPEFLVDRRTDFFRSEWAAAQGDAAPWIRMRWGVPIRARELVIYGARIGRGVLGSRDQSVVSVEIRTALDGRPQEWQINLQPISASGTRIPLNQVFEFDTLEVKVLSSTGRFEGKATPALAEIEVLAQALEGAVPALRMVRGDSNCDGAADLSDAVMTLGALFLGRGPLCCEAAADADDDDQVNITDSIFLMAHLFQGGPPPGHPYPACGRVYGSVLLCDTEVCQ